MNEITRSEMQMGKSGANLGQIFHVPTQSAKADRAGERETSEVPVSAAVSQLLSPGLRPSVLSPDFLISWVLFQRGRPLADVYYARDPFRLRPCWRPLALRRRIWQDNKSREKVGRKSGGRLAGAPAR